MQAVSAGLSSRHERWGDFSMIVCSANPRGLASHGSYEHIHQRADDFMAGIEKCKSAESTVSIFKQKKRCLSSAFLSQESLFAFL
jgi:hypothetical protein